MKTARDLDALMIKASLAGAIEIYRHVGRIADLQAADQQTELVNCVQDAFIALRPEFVAEWQDAVDSSLYTTPWGKALLQAQAVAVALRACRTMGLGPAIAALQR